MIVARSVSGYLFESLNIYCRPGGQPLTRKNSSTPVSELLGLGGNTSFGLDNEYDVLAHEVSSPKSIKYEYNAL